MTAAAACSIVGISDTRHTPCQIADDHILIREDKVLQVMLEGLGASVTQVTAPFTPEGGAYGHGRTHGHEH